MDSARAKEIRQKMSDKKEAKKKIRMKGFITKRRRQNLKEWITFQRQRFNFEEERKKKMIVREKTIKERSGELKDVKPMGQEEVYRTVVQYHGHMSRLEEDLYDLDYDVAFKNMQINHLRLELDEMKGKFIKPQLKKVRKTANWN